MVALSFFDGEDASEVGEAPAEAPALGLPGVVGLPANSEGVAAVASVPVGSDSDGSAVDDTAVYHPPNPVTWVDGTMPADIFASEVEPRWTLGSWQREYLNDFVAALSEHSLLEQMMQ